MFPFAQAAGARAALQSFGVKCAGDWDDYLEEVQRQGIGQPRAALKQFQKGQLFHPSKGLISKNLPRSPGAIAAALAWPIMGSFLQARANPDTGRGELVGDLIGRSAGSLLGGPLGMAGQIGGGMLLAPVGQEVGKAYDSAVRAPVVSDE